MVLQHQAGHVNAPSSAFQCRTQWLNLSPWMPASVSIDDAHPRLQDAALRPGRGSPAAPQPAARQRSRRLASPRPPPGAPPPPGFLAVPEIRATSKITTETGRNHGLLRSAHVQPGGVRMPNQLHDVDRRTAAPQLQGVSRGAASTQHLRMSLAPCKDCCRRAGLCSLLGSDAAARRKPRNTSAAQAASGDVSA